MSFRWTISIGSETVVVSRDPEMAEMGNPNGQRYGERFFLVATDAKGYRRRHHAQFTTPEEAEGYFMAQAGPVYGRDWEEWYPEYGSEAYSAMEPELVAMEKRDALDFESYQHYDWVGPRRR